jgi:hypothetical protein
MVTETEGQIMKKSRLRWMVLGLAGLLVACTEPPADQTAADEPPARNSQVSGDGWLLGADSDQTRFERLHSYLGGFSAAMWETGYRYEAIYHALERENPALAAYHWDKILDAIAGGYMKRPARQENADNLFINAVGEAMAADLESGDVERAWQGLARVREACLACHIAEEVPFMNDMPMFELEIPGID